MAYKDPERKKEAARLYHEKKKNDPEYIRKRKEHAKRFHKDYKNPNLTPEKSREYSRNHREKHLEEKRKEDREYKRKISQNEDYKEKRRIYRENNKEKHQDYQKKYQEDGRSEWSRLKHRYGITKEQFLNQLEKQNQCCLICLQPFGDTKPHVDHCHETGKFRGLLHRPCNLLLGFAQDNVNILSNAINYLNEHTPIQQNEQTIIKSGQEGDS